MAGISAGTRLVDEHKIVQAFGNALPSTSTSAWVNLQNASHVAFVFSVKNATTVTGSAITFNQASDVAGTGSKSLGFTSYFYNLDTSGPADALSAGTAVSNTFTTTAVNSKQAIYVVEFNSTDLDINNGFTCVQAALATGVATNIAVLAVVTGLRFGGNVAQNPSVIV